MIESLNKRTPESPEDLLKWVKSQKPSAGDEKLQEAVKAGLLSVEVEPDEPYKD